MDLIGGDLRRIFARYLATTLGSAVVDSIYISVDLICVGHYCGPDGSAAISCVNPVWSIMIALGLLLGVGGSVWLSNRRGAGDETAARQYFTVSMEVAAVLSVALTLVYVFLQEPLLRFFGADDRLLGLAVEYVQWIAWTVPAFLMGIVLSSFIRNDGAPGICAVSLLLGGGVNMVGDVFFVFDFGLGLGASGAGMATALGQLVAIGVLGTYFFRKSCGLRLSRPDRGAEMLWRVCGAGFAPAVVDLTFGGTVILFNRQIMSLAGATELAVFGTVSSIAVLCQNLFYGVGQAVQPIVSANFGAGEFGRVARMRRLFLESSLAMGLVFCLLTALLPRPLLRLFMSVSRAVAAVGPGALRVYGLSFLIMGVNVVATYYLESVLRPRQSLVVSLARGVVFPSGLVLLLPACLGVGAIWWAMPLTELLTLGYTLYALRRDGVGPAAVCVPPSRFEKP